ncbi:MAG: lipoprotein 17-related variable surface protein [Treponema sp.]
MKLHYALAAMLLCAAVGCTAVHSPKTGITNSGNKISTDTEYTVINQEVEKVEISVPNKAELTAKAVTKKDITAKGYNTSIYSIMYKNIIGNSELNQVDVTFSLKKGGIESKEICKTVSGFKASDPALSEQEQCNQEVEKVILSVTDAAAMTAEELTQHQDKITASNYNTGIYTLHYAVIKPDNARKEAAITFYLTKTGGVRSKDRTLTVTGFKEKVIPQEKADITERELLTLFNITETKISASAAAKKIAANGTFGAVHFTENRAEAYDDTKGTFTVYVSGTKDGKPFAKKLTVSGFTHPYAAAPQSVHSYTLNYDAAIRANKPLEEHIRAINTDSAKAFTGSFSMRLENGLDVQLGEHEDYRLTVTFASNAGNVCITPKLSTKNRIKRAENTVEEPVATVDSTYGVTHLNADLKKPYFVEKDVLNHILNAVKDDADFISVEANAFASQYYAKAMVLKTTPQGLFKTDKLKPYTDVYETKGSGYLEIKGLSAFIYTPVHNAITANDYDGSLEFTYCIASNNAFAENFPAAKTSDTQRVTKTGFKKIDTATAQTIFSFDLPKNFGFKTGKYEHTAAWKRKTTMMNGLTDMWLLREKGSAGGSDGLELNTQHFFRETDTNPYYLTLNAQNIEKSLAIGSDCGLSKGRSGEKILIKRIMVQKEGGQEYLTIKITFCGRDTPIEWKLKPLL